MTNAKIEIGVKVAWWFRPYMYCLTLFAVLMRREPDPIKLNNVILRAIRLTIK